MAKSDFSLSNDAIKKNIEALQNLMREKDLTHFYISSYDPFISEYVPLKDCHRYYISGFTGSMAETLVPVEGKVKLFVDGRYHEQADNEVDLDLIEVVKVGMGKSNMMALYEQLPKDARVAYEALRTPLRDAEELKSRPVAKGLDSDVASAIQFADADALNPIESVEAKVDIYSAQEKIQRVFKDFKDNEAIYLSALDDIAWVSNCRGYHMPHMCSFLSRAVLTNEKLYVFIEPHIKVGDSVKSDVIEFIKVDSLKLDTAMESLKGKFDTLYYDSSLINAYDYSVLHQVFGSDVVREKKGGLTPYKSIKDEKELQLIRDSFKKSDRAITDTLNWIRECMNNGEKITELDVYHKTTEFYKKQGAVEQSFNTISGVGPHSSIIHYSSPTDKVVVKEDDVVLIDSGGYFDPGFATDTTRTILAKKDATPDPKLKEIFTLVLKGMLNCQAAEVEEGTSGVELDKIARAPIQAAGYDYAHGTGHGVGLYVHEGGAGISPRRDDKVKPGQVISVEPGIYIPGFGGVRHENIVIVNKHPEKEGYVKFEPLVYIEFDESLLDESLLTEDEKVLFHNYQKKCQERGTVLN